MLFLLFLVAFMLVSLRMADAAGSLAGDMLCDKCRSKGRISPLVPMKTGKGFRCGSPGNRFVGGKWSVCDHVEWKKGGRKAVAPPVLRPASFPAIAAPTDEQNAIRDFKRQSPACRGTRCLIVDAGPGSGKTTTVAWCMRWVFERIGQLLGYFLLAFNKNAARGLEGKLPPCVPDISTMNSQGGRVQGYRFSSYDKKKTRKIFDSFVQHIDPKTRPDFAPMGGVIERMRDLLLYNPDANGSAWWGQAIRATLARFPGLAKSMEKKPEQLSTLLEWLPRVYVRASQDAATIDLSEQVSRPVIDAIARSGWLCPIGWTVRGYQWSDSDLQHLAALIRSVKIAPAKGLILDEAQDLSLCQLVFFMAQAQATGEITLVGDDKRSEPDEEDYKAGQAIFGWRGAQAGSLTLACRLWRILTGETPKRLDLSVTHRMPPEIVDAVRELNRVLKSSQKRDQPGRGAWTVNGEQAFSAWCELPEGQTALWITRTNAPLGLLLLATLRARKKVCLRGGGELEGPVDAALFHCAGWYNDNGDYKCTLAEAMRKLGEKLSDEEETDDPNSISAFLLEIGEEILRNPDILLEADLPAEATVGNLRRFVLYFANADAPRVLSTVYRSKGDEADTVIVSDTCKFNEAWNDDDDEAAACRHVAATRARKRLYIVGELLGVNAPKLPGEETD